jgi:DNA-binding response OmpR family regulator
LNHNSLAWVIEDDEAHAKLFCEALLQAGYQVEVIRDGRAALARFAQGIPAVVVLDINLPYIAGTDILRHIRGDKRLAKVRVIIASADERIAATLHNDADLVLIKPISYPQLRDLSQRLKIDGPLAF